MAFTVNLTIHGHDNDDDPSMGEVGSMRVKLRLSPEQCDQLCALIERARPITMGRMSLLCEDVSIIEVEKELPCAGIDAWLRGPDVGLSALAILEKLTEHTHHSWRGGTNHPHDISDFRRCLSLLDAAPELAGRMSEMAEVSDQWRRLVTCWADIAKALCAGDVRLAQGTLHGAIQ